MDALKWINIAISIVFTVCYAYQMLYFPVQWFKIGKKRKYMPVVNHRFAVLICGRNESGVIGQLIKSVNGQTYPSELVDVFVCADNCTDNTAEISADAGAIVYERFNEEYIGKGYALEYLLEMIQKDYGEYDGYFVFDADNILDVHFIEEMNKTFSQGYNIITSYRNSKNYGDNWISAGYALWFIRESRYLNESRMILGTSCAVSGTGFVFSNKILKKYGGWPFHLLTEDIEFSVKNVIEGEIIGFSKDAVLYDEQPTSFVQSWNQRLRWSKGFIQVFCKYGKSLFGGIFKRGFSCYDLSMVVMPAFAFTILSIVVGIVIMCLAFAGCAPVIEQFYYLISTLLRGYFLMWALGVVTTISEWKYIYTSAFKKILYCFTFPIFLATYIPISFVALFAKVSWKQIKHNSSKSDIIDIANGKSEEKV